MQLAHFLVVQSIERTRAARDLPLVTADATVAKSRVTTKSFIQRCLSDMRLMFQDFHYKAIVTGCDATLPIQNSSEYYYLAMKHVFDVSTVIYHNICPLQYNC